jgi:hypothetical protein
MEGFQSAGVGLHCKKIMKIDTMANVTCSITMAYRHLVRSGFGSRRWFIRMAMEIFGKLKEPGVST